jgi:hypothetical protein
MDVKVFDSFAAVENRFTGQCALARCTNPFLLRLRAFGNRLYSGRGFIPKEDTP